MADTIKRGMIDPKTGKMKIWDKVKEKFRYAYPVDVREQLALGTASLYKPGQEQIVEDDEKTAQLTAVRVKKMTAKKLKELVESEKPGLDLSEYEKLSDKRQAVIDALGLIDDGSEPVDVNDSRE